MKKKLVAGLILALSAVTVCPAADFTKVSLTPGADDTELNFTWYSEKTASQATPVVHFGTDKDNLETFEGTSGDVDQDLTGDKAYEYNHVTVTGLESNTTYYYTVEKNGEQTEVTEHTAKGMDTVKILYVGDPQVGASKGQTHGKYEFRLNEDGSDYDWDHATNVDTEEQITLAPEDGDTDAQATL